MSPLELPRRFAGPSIGQLRERLTIQGQTRTQKATGESSFTWTTVGTVRALIGVVNGESDGRIGDEPLPRLRAVIRYRDDVRTTMRGVWDGKTYEFRSVSDPDGFDRWLVIDMQATAQENL